MTTSRGWWIREHHLNRIKRQDYEDKLNKTVNSYEEIFQIPFRNKTRLASIKSCSLFSSVHSVAYSCLTLCNPMDCSTPGLPVHHQLLELTHTHVHWVGSAIQPTHPLSSPSLPTFHLSQHQGLFQWVSSSQQVTKVLEFQLQHQSLQWIFKTDFL